MKIYLFKLKVHICSVSSIEKSSENWLLKGILDPTVDFFKLAALRSLIQSKNKRISG